MEKLRGLLAKRGVTSTLVALELAMAGQSAVAAPAGLATTVTTSALAAATAQATTFLAQLIAGLKTAAVTAAVITAFVSGGLVIKSANTARDAEQALIAEKQRLVIVKNQAAQLANRLTEIEQNRTTQQRTLAELKTTVAAKIQRLGPKFNGEKIVEGLLQLNLDAEMEAYMKTIMRTLFSSQHFNGPLLTSLQLTPEQTNRFFEICQGNDPFMPTYKFFDEGNGNGRFDYSFGWENKGLDKNAMRQLLGEAGFKQYEEDFKTSTIRTLVVNKLASNLVYTDAPLNATVAKQLTLILANAAPDPENPSITDINWAKALKEAKTVLTPTQLTALARLSGNLSTKWSYDF